MNDTTAATTDQKDATAAPPLFTDVMFKLPSQVSNLGRNGYTEGHGVFISPRIDCVSMEPVNSRQRVTRCRVAFPMENAGEVMAAIARAAACTFYVVEGLHWAVPGKPMTLHATRAGAETEAASLVNLMLESGGMEQDATAENYADRLQALRRHRYVQITGEEPGDDWPDEDEDDDGPAVWITELALKA